MAAKRIVKFIFKMIVAAAILVGAYFGINALAGNNKKTSIIDTSYNAKISTQIVESHANLVSDNPNLQTKINIMDDINGVLIQYYNYYIMLTAYKNYNSSIAEGTVINKINEFSKLIEETARYDSTIKNAPAGSQLREDRALLTAKKYAKQTEKFFEVVELLKQYVYQSNYNMETTGIVYEVQLEMIKDYSKAAFNFAIKDKVDYTIPESVLKEGNTEKTSSSLIDMIAKFNNRQSLAVNGNVEVSFVQNYNNIDKTELNAFYLLNATDKQARVDSITDETQWMNYNSLLEYLKQEHI